MPSRRPGEGELEICLAVGGPGRHVDGRDVTGAAAPAEAMACRADGAPSAASILVKLEVKR